MKKDMFEKVEWNV